MFIYINTAICQYWQYDNMVYLITIESLFSRGHVSQNQELLKRQNQFNELVSIYSFGLIPVFFLKRREKY